jgi:4'-phosphopantetheinyl transferase
MAEHNLAISALYVDEIIDEDLFQKLLTLVAADKQERIKRFYRRADAQRALFGELLIRVLLMQSENLSNSDISFTATEFGKPALTNFPGIHFNISHSGSWVVCATDTTEVGIDVEQISEMDLSVSENVFCAVEHQAIITCNNPTDKFFQYWALKESYIKLIGKGLSQPLNSFGIALHDNNVIHLEINGSHVKDVYFKQYHPDKNYHMAVCARHNYFPSTYNLYQISDLIHILEQNNTL